MLLISCSHHIRESDNDTGKSVLIADYNHTKGGVDEVDKKYSIYCCSCKSRRWPIAIFQRMLHMTGNNSFVMFQNCSERDDKMRRGFLLYCERFTVESHENTRIQLKINIVDVIMRSQFAFSVPKPLKNRSVIRLITLIVN